MYVTFPSRHTVTKPYQEVTCLNCIKCLFKVGCQHKVIQELGGLQQMIMSIASGKEYNVTVRMLYEELGINLFDCYEILLQNLGKEKLSARFT